MWAHGRKVMGYSIIDLLFVIYYFEWLYNQKYSTQLFYS